MINYTQVTYFTLSAYFDTRLFRYVFFMVVLLLYIVILGSNLLLIVVICVNRSLHEPMYMFLCSLFVNELYGSTGLFPFLLVQILSDIHTVSASLCFLQVFCLYSYSLIQILNLTVISYDRYLAICFPLQYNTRMTLKRVAMLIALTWFLSFLEVSVLLSLTSSLQLCGNIINKVYCDNYLIVKLSCFDISVNNIFGIVAASLFVFGPLSLILFTYLKIIKVCFSGSKQTRQKAVSTCTPHLTSLINYLGGAFFELTQSRFNMSTVPNMLRIFLSLYWLTCQPIFNPLMYGLKLSKIRSLCQSLFFGKNVN